MTNPPLYLFLSSEESREEDTVKDKSNLGKYERAWVRDRNTCEYMREEDRRTAVQGGTDVTCLRASKPGCWRENPQSSLPEHEAQPYLNPLSREMHLASC